jgi:hypothetical protein
MLKPEQATKELEKLQDKEWVHTRLPLLKKLPATLRSLARPLLGHDDDGREMDWKERGKEREALSPMFKDITAAQRVELFEALFPGLGAMVEKGWQLFDHLPYDAGYEMKAFRAPGRDALLLDKRLDWVAGLAGTLGPLPQRDLAWHAAWSAHYGRYGASDQVAILLAAAIDAGGKEGDEVFEVLCASARGEHEIGGMGRHVTRALLSASREDGWEFVEKMLLAAQREEGLRQTILETVDAAHPKAFARMLRLIQEHDLARFSATVRALDTWLGYLWDSVSVGVVNQTIEKLTLYLDDKSARAAALKGKDAEQAYLALWSIAFHNAMDAIEPAAALLKHPKPEFRFAAAHLLSQLGVNEATEKLLRTLEDEDLHVSYCLLASIQHGQMDEALKDSDLFERLEKLLPRLPQKPLQLKPLVWPWTNYKIQRDLVAGPLVETLGKRPPSRLIPHLPNLGVYPRVQTLRLLAGQEKLDAASRRVLLDHVGDASRDVRTVALEGLSKSRITAAEAPGLEELLTRSAGDLRRGVLGVLLKLPDTDALASADRLLASKSAPQRLAGLELLRQLADTKRCLAEGRERATAYRAARPKLADAERQQIESIEGARAETVTLDNALGLITDDERTWPEKPVNRQTVLHSPAAVQIIKSLDDLVHEHREKTITFRNWSEQEQQQLLGECRFGFPSTKHELPLDEDRARLPLLDVWENWWTQRSGNLRDKDGFEMLRAVVFFQTVVKETYRDELEVLSKRCKPALNTLFGNYSTLKVRYDDVVDDLLSWFIRLHPPAGGADFLLDALETSFALVPESELRHVVKEDDYDDIQWHESDSPFMKWKEVASLYKRFAADAWKPAHDARLFRLLRWCDQPFGRNDNLGENGQPLSRNRPDLSDLLPAHQAGGARDADVIEQLLGPREAGRYSSMDFSDLRQLTTRKPDDLLKKDPAVEPLVEKCRTRVLEVELTRGDTPTPASKAALGLSTIYGISNLIAILRALGNRTFTRGWARDNESKETVFSHLTRCSFPVESETIQDFKKQVTEGQIPEQRLAELAVYAPQWAKHVEHALGWKSLVEAVWWIHAHTRGTDWTVDEQIREIWKADLSQRTSLSSEDLLEGAVDVAWFQRVHADLGEKRWAMLDEAAKYASVGSGHARARLFADAMLDKVKKKELVTRANSKRHQDSVRALGLLPLAGGKGREVDLLERYKVMQEFIRTSRQFGSQRQASEKRAAQIGQENLARTAGYADPLRLQWAMEARAVGDLADGPISVSVDGVSVSLGIDPWGDLQFTVTKEGRALADIPAKLKKDKKIAALRERKTELKRQASRIRGALEQFMCRGDVVTGAELQELMKHPLLAPMLRGLVLVGDDVLGYPVHDGKALEDCAGQKEALKKDERIRVAHPHDLLPAAKWHAWQKDCFARERIQPFKQVFRELYTITKAEKEEGIQSRRYAGHQIQPRKALALLGGRGWVHHPEEGVRKTFHDAALTAWLEFDEPFFTPAEIEGLTLESVRFTKRADGKPVKLTDVPPRLFSETMRDLDLVVSVAHRGGVDPEASASTIEMRATLVKETCALLKLSNVRVKDNSVLIKGEMGEYTVHLGSAVTRKMPGETLFIVAVHAQHRGRLFLPFADDDPRTAEVLSKVLLLARDKDIKDPNILDQIRGR